MTDQVKWIEVQPGITWGNLVAETVAHGYTPPVLPDWLHLTVGGTLSVGGLGNRSHSEGFQVEHILEIEVVDGHGNIRTCSSSTHPELFRSLLSGLGQFGCMTRVRTKLVRAPPSVTTFKFLYPNMESFLQVLNKYATGHTFDCFHGFLVHNSPNAVKKHLGTLDESLQEKLKSQDLFLYYLETTSYNWDNKQIDMDSTGAIFEPIIVTKPFTSYVANVPPVMRDNPKLEETFAHPEYCCFVPWKNIQTYLKHVQSNVSTEFPFEALIEPVQTTKENYFSIPSNEGQMVFVLLIRTVPYEKREEIETLVGDFKRLQCFSESMKVHRYFVDANLPVSPQDWMHWLPNWKEGSKLKHQYDPDHLFVPHLRLWQ